MVKAGHNRKAIFGWAMFDFANSSYTTVIITVVFSVIFPRLIVGDLPDYRMGNFFWSLALAISYFLVMLVAPVLGAITDHAASKKKFLFYTVLITCVASLGLYWVLPGRIAAGMILVIVSNLGFCLSESFVSSFLPSLGEQNEVGKISGFAWGFGYFGGLISTSIVMFGLGSLSAENFGMLRFVGPITAIFFLVASIPTFILVPEPPIVRENKNKENAFISGWKRVGKTLHDIRDYKDLFLLLLSFIFAYAGLSIVISFTFIFGDQVISWKGSTQLIMFVITQLTAAIGALLFGILQDHWSSRKTYIVTLILWVLTVTMIFGVQHITGFVNNLTGKNMAVEHMFLIIGSIAGLGLGSTQSACRAMVALFSPSSKSGEFFGLWEMAAKIAAIMGLLGLGWLQIVFGLRKSIMLCSMFFIIALIIAFFIQEERGKKNARTHEGD